MFVRGPPSRRVGTPYRRRIAEQPDPVHFYKDVLGASLRESLGVTPEVQIATSEWHIEPFSYNVTWTRTPQTRLRQRNSALNETKHVTPLRNHKHEGPVIDCGPKPKPMYPV